MSATTRRKFKKIEKLTNEAQVEVKDQAGLCDVAKSYFNQLFEAKENNQEPVLSLIQSRVSSENNERLLAPITKEELHTTLLQMHPDKSPGPDGFNSAFY
ncbi:hypothetical protein QL285_051993 [Trifolium repens]|nr:hypothetical protein QL285_051993 [Trifolium repens]